MSDEGAEGAPIRRSLTLADGMILIVGIAVGFGLVRYRNDARASTVVGFLFSYGSAIGVGLSLALLGLLFLPPCPDRRTLANRFGTTPSIVVPFMLIFQSTFIFLGCLWRPRSEVLYFAFDDLIALIGMAILGHWLMLFLSGIRRSPSDWVEWMSRILGAYWILLLLVFLWSYYG